MCCCNVLQAGLSVWFWIKIKKLNILQINVEDIQQQRLSVGTKNTWLGFGKLHGSALKKLFATNTATSPAVSLKTRART